ncbi:hypothetical protein [Brevibacterium aurantiacum]|uniref:hypothetical protein n=1 Tax=Brevibacterium aurantiacum TaxID=273384 RepID=UPI0021B2FA5A|nr:hypothetical protein [Brevibacterium aurantiacum]
MISYLSDATQALRMWGARRILVAIAAACVSVLVIGVSTVLIPNSLFSRDIPPVWWDYPIWILMSVLIGLLIATYVGESGAGVMRTNGGTFGTVGGMLGWFAVGCPVCNKIALLVLGYTGALTYFAPLQPVLAVLSVLLLLVAVVVRLKGQFSCPVPTRERSRLP